MGSDRDRLRAHLIGRSAGGVEWTDDLVRYRLAEAAKGCERLVDHVGPRFVSTFWPDMKVEFGDRVAMLGTKELEAFYKARNRAPARVSYTDKQVSAIEQAIEWPGKYLRCFEDERRALKIWAWCVAKRAPFDRFYILAANHRSTALRRRDRAFSIIRACLTRDGVLP